jgi:hypothetical protein
VVSGRENNADLVRFAKRSRQRSGFALRKHTAGPLWQDGYYEHILRDHEPLAKTIRYIANNPVRAASSRTGNSTASRDRSWGLFSTCSSGWTSARVTTWTPCWGSSEGIVSRD